jgi:hypothetical protein
MTSLASLRFFTVKLVSLICFLTNCIASYLLKNRSLTACMIYMAAYLTSSSSISKSCIMAKSLGASLHLTKLCSSCKDTALVRAMASSSFDSGVCKPTFSVPFCF